MGRRWVRGAGRGKDDKTGQARLHLCMRRGQDEERTTEGHVQVTLCGRGPYVLTFLRGHRQPRKTFLRTGREL